MSNLAILFLSPTSALKAQHFGAETRELNKVGRRIGEYGSTKEETSGSTQPEHQARK